MQIFIIFWSGDTVKFDSCNKIESDLGLLLIYENNKVFEYATEDIKRVSVCK